MWRVFKKINEVGLVTDIDPNETDFAQLGQQLKRKLTKHFQGSIAIRQVDAGSCNGCELEIHALNNPYYSVEQFGVNFVASPRHADVLLVTGPVTKHMEEALLRTYHATPHPKWVIATGDCAICGGEFGSSYAMIGAVSKVIPVDLEIAGCPPTPTQLVSGLLALVKSVA